MFRIILVVLFICLAAGTVAAQDHDPPTPTQIPSVHSMFAQLVDDGRHLATGRNLEVIANGAATALLFKPDEVRVNAKLTESRD